MSWTDQHIDALRGYLSENGVTFAQAAVSLNQEFGTSYSRNAIIGKCGREKILSKNQQHAHGTVRQQTAKPPVAVRRRRHRPEPQTETFTLRSVPIEPRNLPLIDLQPGECRWPVTDGPPHLFCGRPVRTGNYCAGHFDLSKRNRE